MNEFRANRYLFLSLHLGAFFSGFVTMSLEMLIGRTFVPYFGGTIYTWGALISVFLIGMTIGYMVGGRMADRWPNSHLVEAIFVAAAVAVVVVPFFGETLINLILDRVEDLRYAALLSAVSLACIPAALLAAVGPFCLRLLLDQKSHSGTVSGRLSALSTFGSIFGTLGTSFWLIPNYGVHSIYTVLAGVSLVTGLIIFVFSYRQRLVAARPETVVAVSVLAIVCCLPFDARAQHTPSLMHADGVIEKIDSEYNTIIIEKQGNVISLNFGYRANRYTESAMDLTKPSELIVPYTRYMAAAVAFDKSPIHRIALVGLGGGRTINYLSTSIKDSISDVAELDPSVMKAASDYFGIESNDRLHINNKDGRIFLTQSKDKYDLVLLDAYRGPFVPFHLTTQEFYRIVKRHLAPGGVVAQNVEPTTLFFDSAYLTMKSVFDQVDFIEANGNIVLVGYSGDKLSDAELMARAKAQQDRYNFKYDLKGLVTARKNLPTIEKGKILTDDFAPVEDLKTIKRHNEKMQ